MVFVWTVIITEGGTVAKSEHNYFQSLYDVAAAITSAQTQESVLQSIVEKLAKTMDAKGCSLMLLNPDKTLLLHTAVYGLSEWYVNKGRVSADQSISEALKGKSTTILNAATDKRIQYRLEAKREGVASILSVPIKPKDEVIGVIRVYTAEPRHFTKNDITFVGTAANLGAIALEHTRREDTTANV